MRGGSRGEGRLLLDVVVVVVVRLLLRQEAHQELAAPLRVHLLDLEAVVALEQQPRVLWRDRVFLGGSLWQ